MSAHKGDRARFLTALGYCVVLGSSFWFAVRFGGTPQSKLALMIGGLIVWWAVFGWLRPRIKP